MTRHRPDARARAQTQRAGRGGALCLAAASWMAAVAVAACGDDLYAPCDTAADCSPPEGRQAACVDKEGTGFCSWLCDDDPDCDTDDGVRYVCASFEQNPDEYCFPACDGDVACPDGFECRSTGGGVNQRRVCFPI